MIYALSTKGSNLDDHSWYEAFLRGYLEGGTVAAGCKAAGVNRTVVNKHVGANEAFAEACAVVEEELADDLEAEARRRAMGWDETRYTKDGDEYTVRQFSDRLMELLLKASRPEKYRETKEAAGAVQGQAMHISVYMPEALAKPRLERARMAIENGKEAL